MEQQNPFAHLIPAYEALTPDQRKPTTGSSLPTGGPLETLDEEGLAALKADCAPFDEARLSAARNLRRMVFTQRTD